VLDDAEPGVIEHLTSERLRLERLLARDDATDAELSHVFAELGAVYLAYELHDAAQICLEHAHQLGDTSFRTLYLLGYVFQIKGMLREAAAAFGEALEQEPLDYAVLLRLGTIELLLDETDRAEELFERALARKPDLASALEGLGKVAVARGDDTRAVELFSRALDIQPSATSLHHALGLAYRRLGNLDDSSSHLDKGGDAPVLWADPLLLEVLALSRSAGTYRRRAAEAFARGRFPQAAELSKRALELDPEDFRAQWELGLALDRLGDLDGAVKQLEHAVQLLPSVERSPPTTTEQAELHTTLASLLVRRGDDTQAVEQLRRALEILPGHLDAHLKLASLRARRGEFTQALEHYDEALEAAPDSWEVLVGRATVFVNLGQVGKARADFERAIAVAAHTPIPRLRYAEALEYLGEPALAEQQLDLAREECDDVVCRALVLRHWASAKLRRGDPEAALAHCRAAVELDPASPELRELHASLLGHLGRFQEALEGFDELLAAQPERAPAHRGKVITLVLMQRWSEARSALELALQRMPHDATFAHALARLLAIAPADEARHAQHALTLAQQLLATRPQLAVSETYAMALAEAGRYAEAAQRQRELVAQAERDGAPGNQLILMRQRAETYGQHRAWRARSPEEIITALTMSEVRAR